MRLLTGFIHAATSAALLVALFAVVSAFAAPGDTVADRVFGQGGSFTTNTANNGGLSASSLSYPSSMAVDGAGRLYVADFANNRVLEYDTPLTSQTATRVFGQGGSFTTNTANNGGLSANSLYQPWSVAVDSAGRLYVADAGNNRVLEYDTPITSQTATRVFGQGGSFTANTANNGGVSASSLAGPVGVALDSAGRLYVADTDNQRVLEYDSPLTSQTATRVFGQAGSFTTNTGNNGGVSASSLFGPVGVALDSAGHLYVADTINSRVLEYDSPLTSQTATRVFGQGGSFTANTANNGGVSASSLAGPVGVALDSAGRLYVADKGNNRVLEYDSPITSQTATRVFGQAGSFTSNTANNGGLSASSLTQPLGIALDSAGRLYIADFNNNRVLGYDSPVAPAASVGGIAEQPNPSSLRAATGKPSSRSYPLEFALAALGAVLLASTGGYAARRWRKRS